MDSVAASKTIPLPTFLRLVRVYFSMLGAWLPGVSARLFWRLFTTPIRNSLKPPHLALLAKAERYTFKMESIPGGQTRTLQAYKWHAHGPRRALLLHGWSGKALDYYKLIPMLTEAGLRVEAFDFAAHGASTGQRTHALELMAAVRTYVAEFGMPEIIIAHSLGAAATAWLLAHEPLQVHMLVMLAQPVHLAHAFDVGFATLHVPKNLRASSVRYVENLLRMQLHPMSLARMPDEIKAERLLVVRVPGDEEIPDEHFAEFAARHPQAEVYNALDTTHSLVLRNKAALAWVVGQIG